MGRQNAHTFRGPGASRSPPPGVGGGNEGCPMGGRGDFRLARGSLRPSRVSPKEHPCRLWPVPRESTARAARGRPGRGKGKEGGGGKGIPLSLGQAVAEGARGQAESGMLQTAEPGSRRLHRQPGALQRPPHRPLDPQGPRTSAAKALGPDIPRDRPQLPGDPAGTPQPPSTSQRL